jgi:hypothetical protein
MSFDGYYVTADISARNADIANLQTPGATSLFTYAEIPPSMIPDKSPVFNDTATMIIFTGDTAVINNSATDADGDRLTYSFNNPFNSHSSSTFIPSLSIPPRIPYLNSTFNINQPFGANSYASINNSTGQAKFYSPTAGNYVVSYQVKEYRNINGTDVLIGSTIRDIQLIVKNGPTINNTAPAITYSGTKTINITEGQAITPITFTFTDADPGQLLTVNASSPLLDGPGNKNASFNSSTSGPAIISNVGSGTTATFNYTAACGEANTYPLNITITDNACPPASRTETFQIVVVSAPRLFAPTDADACETHSTTLVTGTGSTDNAAFTLTPAGALSINTTPDFETKTSYTLRIRTTDLAGTFTEKAVTVSINNVDEAPSAPSDLNVAANTVAENAANGTLTGITASAIDPEGAGVTFSLSNNAGGRFAIDAATGIVTVANATLLDYETSTSHQITVQATDGTLNSSQSFTIAVSDIDEIAPTALIASTAPNPTVVSPIPVSVTFSEPVLGFSDADITVSGGAISNFSGSGSSYNFAIVPAAAGNIVVNIPAGGVTDLAGNNNTAATPFSITYIPTGIKEEASAANLNLKLYPNPSAGEFKLELGHTDRAYLTITDLAGKTVLQKAVKANGDSIKETVSLQVAKGIYLLRVQADNQTLFRKIIVE